MKKGVSLQNIFRSPLIHTLIQVDNMFITYNMILWVMILAWPMLANAKPYNHWRPTKVETTGATLNYETLISRLFETFLDFETKKQVVPRHAGTP